MDQEASQIILFEELSLGARDSQAPSTSSDGDEQPPGVCGVLRIAALKAAGALDESEPAGAHARARALR